MRTLHSYLTRQVIVTTLMTVAVFTFVLLIGNVIQKIFELLLNEQTTPGAVVAALVYMLPHALVFALPMGMLTAMLLTFGKLSAERELTAMRSSGVSVVTLVSPLLLLAGAFAVVCLYVNCDLSPRCRTQYKNLVFDLANKRPTSILTAGSFTYDVKGYGIYVRDIDRQHRMHDLMISKFETNGEISAILRAKQGVLERLPETNQFILRLFDAAGAKLEGGQWRALPYLGESEYPVSLSAQGSRDRKLNEFTFLELRARVRELERAQQRPVALTGLSREQLAEKLGEVRQLTKDLITPLRVEMHQQLAFSFACIGFTLIGVPLGIRGQRKETSIGVAIALVLVLVYYSFFIVSRTLEGKPEYHPWIICWAANFVFQALGAVLLWRVNRN